jgi:hypothetical protein
MCVAGTWGETDGGRASEHMPRRTSRLARQVLVNKLHIAASPRRRPALVDGAAIKEERGG